MLFLIFLIVQILFFLTHHYIKHSLAPLRLSPELYLLRPGEEHHKYRSRLLLQNSTGGRAGEECGMVRRMVGANIKFRIFFLNMNSNEEFLWPAVVEGES